MLPTTDSSTRIGSSTAGGAAGSWRLRLFTVHPSAAGGSLRGSRRAVLLARRVLRGHVPRERFEGAVAVRADALVDSRLELLRRSHLVQQVILQPLCLGPELG